MKWLPSCHESSQQSASRLRVLGVAGFDAGSQRIGPRGDLVGPTGSRGLGQGGRVEQKWVYAMDPAGNVPVLAAGLGGGTEGRQAQREQTASKARLVLAWTCRRIPAISFERVTSNR